MYKVKNIVTVKHGPHLYNLNHALSDIDLYTIYDFINQRWRPRRQVEQKINDETDHVKISLEKFLLQVEKGVPQALEVLFAHAEHWLDHHRWEDLRTQCLEHLDIYTALDTYQRTIINFFKKDDFKKNRHGFRLLLNAESLKNSGSFNPTLTDKQAVEITCLANASWNKRQDLYKDQLWKVFS